MAEKISRNCYGARYCLHRTHPLLQIGQTLVQSFLRSIQTVWIQHYGQWRLCTNQQGTEQGLLGLFLSQRYLILFTQKQVKARCRGITFEFDQQTCLSWRTRLATTLWALSPHLCRWYPCVPHKLSWRMWSSLILKSCHRSSWTKCLCSQRAFHIQIVLFRREA